MVFNPLDAFKFDCFFQPAKWSLMDFQLRVLDFVTIYLMLASTGAESPTLIMAFQGVGLKCNLALKTNSG
jgi:hypothetical protein